MSAAPQTQVLLAPRLFDGQRWQERMAVHITGGRITSVGPIAGNEAGAVRLPEKSILAPGLIDLQVNGGGGALLNDAPIAKTVRTMLAAHRAHGTSAFLPTLITDHPDKLQHLADAAPEIAAIPGVLGLHIEGPFLNVIRKGVHPAEFIRTPTTADLDAILRMATILPLIVTLAPECVPTGIIGKLVKAGVRMCIGHSDATADQVRAACDEGATGVTHLFNAMSQMMGRAPGVVGTAFDDRRLTSGIICDGLHVTPANLRTAFKVLGQDRMALVTDAMPTVGSPQAHFALQGRRISLVNGKLSAPGEVDTLAGAHLGMLEAVQKATKLMGATLDDALIMASVTPARFLGREKHYGRIAPGYAAALIAFTDDFRLIDTWTA